MINATLMQRASRLARPGMFVAALASIAVLAAASQLRKLGEQLEETLDEIEGAAQEIDALETKKASTLLEIQGIVDHKDELLAHLRGILSQEIEAGKFDEAVNRRAKLLSDHAPDGGNFPAAGDGLKESTDVNV
jgi:hypothetical protein